MKLTIQMCAYIRQHGRAVYVGMVVVIVYHNTMENAASILQSGNRAHRAVEAKVRTIQKTVIPVLSHENAPARRRRP